MRILIIYNPVSGMFYRHRDTEIRAALAHAWPQVHAVWHYTSSEGSFDAHDPAAYDRIIACGGDGTVKEAAAWLVEKNASTPLGIIPNGTANILAQSLGIPDDARAAIDLALSDRVHRIDVGLVNRREVFLIAAGCGFHSAVIKHTTRRLKRALGFAAYFVGIIRTFFNIRPLRIFVKTDDSARIYTAMSVLVSNFSRLFTVPIHPSASMTDGYLNVTIYRALNFRDIWILASRFLRGDHAADDRLRQVRAREVYVLPFSKYAPMQLDGELVQLPYLDIRVLPGALHIVAKTIEGAHTDAMPAAHKRIIVGLGNPGDDYARTKHNAGFMFVDHLAKAAGVAFKLQKKLHAELAETPDALLVKPTTYMNESGRAVQAVLSYYKLDPAQLTVAHDDTDIAIGSCKLQADRGAAGHNGVQSIIDTLGTQKFSRVRIGVRAEGDQRKAMDFVLARSSADELERIDDAIAAAAAQITKP